jgi:hypothetical protein|tara:strand:+ start:783 stop:932 length:150 start_codon:yes stop_codon:yes gene_type:complete
MFHFSAALTEDVFGSLEILDIQDNKIGGDGVELSATFNSTFFFRIVNIL